MLSGTRLKFIDSKFVPSCIRSEQATFRFPCRCTQDIAQSVATLHYWLAVVSHRLLLETLGRRFDGC